MKFSRRTFIAGVAAAATAAAIPKSRALARTSPESWATLIDLTRCTGCEGEAVPRCVSACRTKNAARFPEPDPAMLKDYWPKDFHEDWSGKRDEIYRLTPYNWLFVDEVYLEINGQDQRVNIPRRCMHCDNPPCVSLCPFGTAQKDADGPVRIEPSLCFGGAKCRAVCPWNVPQRQAGVGPYTILDPMPVGGGAMYKCDLCRDLLNRGETPRCMTACPEQAMSIGPREEILALADQLKKDYNGYLYGRDEHGGTATIYVSKIPFEQIDAAIIEDVNPKKAMRFHQPENEGEKQHRRASVALLAPLAGIVGAFAATIAAKGPKDD
ncbi:MAG: 4Fe-4S ferredoxin [Desulfuromonas sp.]|nr:MAG: 4Fe-4S ferredoxin [Desulfuromonas sp.]